jgi:Flp pilus assembly protein TadG
VRRAAHPPLRSLARHASREEGYTIVELVVVMFVMMLVIGLPMAFIVISLSQQNVSSSRSAAATQEQVGLDRLIRDLRQVVPNTTTTFTWGTTTATVTMTLPVPGTGGASTQSVVWSCSFSATGTCTRQVNGGTSVIEVRNVESVTFSPQDPNGNVLGGSSSPYTATNPSYVSIAMKVLVVSQLDSSATPSHGVRGVSNWVTVQAGVDLWNNSI